MSRDEGEPAMIGVGATVRAEELLVEAPPRTRVRVRPTGAIETTRRGVPPTGTQAGRTYRHIEIRVGITASRRTPRRRRGRLRPKA